MAELVAAEFGVAPHEIACGGRTVGIDRFRFCCEEHVIDTINPGRRTGARALPAELAM